MEMVVVVGRCGPCCLCLRMGRQDVGSSFVTRLSACKRARNISMAVIVRCHWGLMRKEASGAAWVGMGCWLVCGVDSIDRMFEEG